MPAGHGHGALDRTVPVESSCHLAGAIEGATLEVCEGVGHLSLPVEHAGALLTG